MLTKDKLVKYIMHPILAGVMISIGTVCNLKLCDTGRPVAGAFIFAIGLLTIIIYSLPLYTGKIGYVRRFKNMPYILQVLGLNAAGTAFTRVCGISSLAQQSLTSKMDRPLHLTFMLSVICGILIYIAVDNKYKPWLTIMCVMAFILCGAEHSIADLCLLSATKGLWTMKTLVFFIVVILGNAIGSLVFSFITSNKSSQQLKG